MAFDGLLKSLALHLVYRPLGMCHVGPGMCGQCVFVRSDAMLAPRVEEDGTAVVEVPSMSRVANLTAEIAASREQLRLLQGWREHRRARAPSPKGSTHECIWWDELRVRERQLEKMQASITTAPPDAPSTIRDATPPRSGTT